MFFEKERQHFFRPLTSRRRELVVECLKTLYERLHGPAADYANSLTRDGMREMLFPIVQASGTQLAIEIMAVEDELSSAVDEQQITAALIRSLLRDGWIEGFADRSGLVTAYRFTRAGKLFAEALWALDRPRARARQRNMRSCRNSLEAALKNHDAYDLIDAYDHAEKVISDLSEGVDYFQDLVRRLMAEASNTPWDEFIEFLDRFEREFKRQLSEDNAERHRQAIRETISRLRSLEDKNYRAMESQLNDVALWAAKERIGSSTFEWMLDRIEELVEAACSRKQPEMIKAMNNYMRRATAIVQQAMMLRSGKRQHAFASVITHTASLEGESQDAFLEVVGSQFAPAEVRLIDPATFKLRTIAHRRKALTVTLKPRVTREARLASALDRAEANAFALSNEDVRSFLLAEYRLRNRAFRLSTLPFKSAIDVLTAMQAIESIRSPAPDSGVQIKATKLPTRLLTDCYEGNDYLIEIVNNADKTA
jgi:hypothetical protein